MSLEQLGVTPPKGFRDILPRETVVRDYLLDTIVGTYRSYGYERIETPVVEDIRRLQHSDGGENLGLIFKILKRGEKLDLRAGLENEDNLVDLGLRYDFTVPLARYYANNRGALPSVFKSIQIGSVWRAERPQHGRYRQFTQCDIDVIGGSSPFDEIELITVTLDALGKFAIQDALVRVNDRQILATMVTAAGIPSELTGRALVNLDKMDKVGLPGVKDLLLKDGFEATAVEQFIGFAERVSSLPPEERLAQAQREFTSMLPESVFNNLRSIIGTVKVGLKDGNSVVFDPFLVRGMGYYTGPVFEIAVGGFSGSIAGGGRYDKLIGKLSGTDATACGFSIGFERLVVILGERDITKQTGNRKVAIFFDRDPHVLSQVIEAVHLLQAQGAIASMFAAPKNMKAALDKLKQSGFTEFVRFKANEPLLPRALE